MRFRKVQSQYHSVRREAERAVRWAEAYGLQVDDFNGSATGASYYAELSNDEDESRVSLRISRHEPNYSRKSDADIMLYVGSNIFNGNDDTRAWRDYAEELANLSKRKEWPAVVKSFFTSRQHKAQKLAAAVETAESERQARMAQARREYQERSIDRFIGLCGENRIDSARAVELLTANNPERCSLSVQIRKWYKDSALPDIAAVELVLS
jgi:hypothetical protein